MSVIVRAGYLVDGAERVDTAEGADYEAAKAALPVRQAQRIWVQLVR